MSSSVHCIANVCVTALNDLLLGMYWLLTTWSMFGCAEPSYGRVYFWATEEGNQSWKTFPGVAQRPKKTKQHWIGHLPADDLLFRMLCIWTAITVNCSLQIWLLVLLWCAGEVTAGGEQGSTEGSKLPDAAPFALSTEGFDVSPLLCSLRRGRRRPRAGSSSRCSGTSRHRPRPRQAHHRPPSWWGRISRVCRLHKTYGTLLCSLLLVLNTIGQRHIMIHPACLPAGVVCMHQLPAADNRRERWRGGCGGAAAAATTRAGAAASAAPHRRSAAMDAEPPQCISRGR